MKHRLLPVFGCAFVLLVQSQDRLRAQGTEGDLLRQLTGKPAAFSAYLDLATLYRDQGRHNDAIRMLEGAISILREEQRAAPRVSVPPPPPPGTPVYVGGDIAPPSKTKNVNPVYPESARAARLSGAVTVEFTIDTTGKVGNVRVLRSSPPFDEAAVDAVRQWEYEPTLLGGTAVPVITTAVVSFSP